MRTKNTRLIALLLAIMLCVPYLSTVAMAEDVEPEPSDPPAISTVTGIIVNEENEPIDNSMGIKFTSQATGELTWATPEEDGSFFVELESDTSYILSLGGDIYYQNLEVEFNSGITSADLGTIIRRWQRFNIFVELLYCTAYIEVSGRGDTEEFSLESTNTISVKAGSDVSVVVSPMDGCNQRTTYTDGTDEVDFEEQILLSDVINDRNLSFTADDTTAPEIENLIAEDDGEWRKARAITFEAKDNTTAAADMRYWYSTTAALSLEQLEAGEAQEIADMQFIVTENGSYIVYAADASGNVGFRALEVTKTDSAPPVISELIPDTTLWAQTIFYEFTVSDDQEMESVIFSTDGETWCDIDLDDEGCYRITLDKNCELTVMAKDMAGNVSTASTLIENIDRISPEITAVLSQREWAAESNEISFAVSDNVEVSVITVSFGESSTEIPINETGIYQYTATENGIYRIIAEDECGNTAEAEVEVDRIDTAVAEITGVYKEPGKDWTAEETVLTISAEDAESGISKAYYCWADVDLWETTDNAERSEWAQMPETEDGLFSITVPNDKDLRRVYWFYAEDNVGRASEEESINVGIDVTAPLNLRLSFSEKPEDGFFARLSQVISDLLYRDLMVVSASTEDTYSGVSYYEYQLVPEDESLQDNKWTRVEGTAEECRIEIETDDFAGSVYIRAYDGVGNCTEAVTDVREGRTVYAVLENTPKNDAERAAAPKIIAETYNETSAEYTPGEWTSDSVYLKLIGTPTVSGIKRYEYQTIPTGKGQTPEEDAWQPVPGYTDDGEGVINIIKDFNADVWVRSVSYANNPSQTAKINVKVQKTLPENAVVLVDGKRGNDKWYVSLPTIHITEPYVEPLAAPVKTYYSFTGPDVSEEKIHFTGINPEIKKDGIYKLNVWTVDAAGNTCAAPKEIQIKADATAPTGLKINEGGTSLLAEDQSVAAFTRAYNKPIIVDAKADFSVSGRESLSYQIVESVLDYNEFGQWQEYSDDKVRIEPDRNQIVFIRAEDKAGNVSIVHSDGIIMDQTEPTGNAAPALSLSATGANENGLCIGNGRVDVSILDPVVNGAMSGLDKIRYQVITDGKVTQDETIDAAENGENIKQTHRATGRFNYIREWQGSVTVLASLNNSNNVVVRVTATDRAGNARTTETELGAIQIDTTPPSVYVSFTNNTADTSYPETYFDAERAATIIVTERNFDPSLAVLKVSRNGADITPALNWVKHEGQKLNGDDTTYSALVSFTSDGEYEFSFSISDLAGLQSGAVKYAADTLSPEKFVIDMSAPVIELTYDNNDVKNGKYFDEGRTATIRVTDTNFVEQRFRLTVTGSLDGKRIPVPMITSWSHTGIYHTAVVEFENDGDYRLDMACKDKSGNEAKGWNTGDSEAPNSFTVDTIPTDAEVTGLQDRKAYPEELEFSLAYDDINLKSSKYKLTRTSMEVKNEDVTDLFTSEKEDRKICFAFPEKSPQEDGIYKFSYSFTDQAEHITGGEMTFTVNRFGSVFEYNDAVTNSIDNYMKEVSDDLLIREYNPSPVEEYNVMITRDGEALGQPEWTRRAVQETGDEWYCYEYTSSKANYERDGAYLTTLSTRDNAENVQENAGTLPAIRFWVDTTPPELAYISGMEEAIVNASAQEIEIQLFDAIGMDNLNVTATSANGEEVLLNVPQFSDEETMSFKTTFEVPEGLRQHIRIVCADKAGNVMDTDRETYKSALPMEDEITVSENFFVRWYANPWVFFGSIFGAATLGVATVGGVIAHRSAKKRKTRRQPK